MLVKVDAIVVNPEQPRRAFDPEELAGLAGSLIEHGLIQPPVVEELGNGVYQLVDGERRWRAARLAGWEEIEVVVRPGMNGTGAQQRTMLALVANVQRSDLNPVEEGQAFYKLRQMGMTLAEIGRQVGLAQSNVGLRLALLELEPEIQALFAHKQLPLHGQVVRAIQSLPDEKRVRIARSLAQKKSTMKTVMVVCQRINGGISGRHLKNPAWRPEHGHYDMVMAVGAEGLTVMVLAAAKETCEACALYEDASPSTCGSCPAVDLLGRMKNGEPHPRPLSETERGVRKEK